MDLKSGYPYWAIKNGLMSAFPRLEADIDCDVLVVGAGIVGALVARALAANGLDVAIVEQRDVAWGSTAASTALLQYEIDTHMTELARRFGDADAGRIYGACADAVLQFGDIARDIGDVGFKRSRSLYFASRWRHRFELKREGELRRRHGLDSEWLAASEIRERFGFPAPAALLTSCAARVDPYRFVSRLLRKLERGGVRIFDRTRIERFDVRTRQVIAHGDAGCTVRARYVVMAAGYASQRWLRASVARNRSSYAFITDPLDAAALGPLRDTMIWETARPYLYLRSTDDGRLIVGGEDDAIDIPARRDARVEKKAAKLQKRARHLFPHLAFEPAFAWGGTFAETRDGLPWFGAHREQGPRMLFAMAYGGNGITYGLIGAELIAATIARRRHPLAALFGFERGSRG